MNASAPSLDCNCIRGKLNEKSSCGNRESDEDNSEKTLDQSRAKLKLN
jgi:hypothetical protein